MFTMVHRIRANLLSDAFRVIYRFYFASGLLQFQNIFIIHKIVILITRLHERLHICSVLLSNINKTYLTKFM